MAKAKKNTAPKAPKPKKEKTPKYNAKAVAILHGEIIEIKKLKELGTAIPEPVFDSKAEAEYYLILKEKLDAGEILKLILQPRYTILKEFIKHGKKWSKAEYVADFEVHYADRIDVIDVKGLETETFKLKWKMFEANYPDLRLTCIKKVQKYGGWITLEDYQKRKAQEKKLAKEKAKNPNQMDLDEQLQITSKKSRRKKAV
jgi:hypothetical protein